MLGAARKITGSQPNAVVPMKGDYFKRDIERCAKVLGVPFTQPDKMPMNSLPASRAFYWLNDSDPQKAKELAQAVYGAHWGMGRDLSDVQEVARGNPFRDQWFHVSTAQHSFNVPGMALTHQIGRAHV